MIALLIHEEEHVHRLLGQRLVEAYKQGAAVIGSD